MHEFYLWFDRNNRNYVVAIRCKYGMKPVNTLHLIKRSSWPCNLNSPVVKICKFIVYEWSKRNSQIERAFNSWIYNTQLVMGFVIMIETTMSWWIYPSHGIYGGCCLYHIYSSMGLLPDTRNCGCACAGNAGNVFLVTASERSRHASRHVRHARAVMHAGIAN